MIWSLLLAACTISEDAFPERAADAYCDRLEECTVTFETDEERANCESFAASLAELTVDAGELLGQEYDAAAGARCVREIRAATCAEFNEAELECDVFADPDA